MQVWLTVIGYEAVWFVAVGTAAGRYRWIGVAVAAAFVAARLAFSRQRALELRLLAVGIVLGLLVDGGAAAAGLIRYAPGTAALPPGGAPLWILGLWAAFALTLSTMRWLRGRVGWGMLLGALAAPLTYAGAARGWHALSLVAPTWRALLWLSLGWAMALAVLIHLLDRWSHAAAMAPTLSPIHRNRTDP